MNDRPNPASFARPNHIALADDLHPAIVAMLALPEWTDHAAVRPLFQMIAQLNAMTARIHELANDKPDLRSLASETGSLMHHQETTGFVNQWRTRTRPNGGAIVSFWQALDDLRESWITARLTAEGLYPHIAAHDERYHDRYSELWLDAMQVEDAFAEFRTDLDRERVS